MAAAAAAAADRLREPSAFLNSACFPRRKLSSANAQTGGNLSQAAPRSRVQIQQGQPRRCKLLEA